MKKLLFSVCIVTSMAVQFMSAVVDKDILYDQLMLMIASTYRGINLMPEYYDRHANNLAREAGGDDELKNAYITFLSIASNGDYGQLQQHVNAMTANWGLDPIDVNKVLQARRAVGHGNVFWR